MTTREIVYYILDLVKQLSDDAYYTEEHIVFSLKKHRALLLEQKALKDLLIGQQESNYQTVCLELEQFDPYDGEACGDNTYLRSTEQIPDELSMSMSKLFPVNYYKSAQFIPVSKNRMRFVGNNKWMKNFIYYSIDPDKYLYLKSNNSNFLELQKVKYSAVFDDFEKAAKLDCDDCDCNDCDILDKEFPLAAEMVPFAIESVLKELLGAAYRPKDDTNDAADDLADLATFVRRNMKSSLAKQMTE